MPINLGMYQQRNNLYPVPQAAVEQAIADAWRCYPDESCGVIYGDEYISFQNIHPSPKDRFEMNKEDYLALIESRGNPDAIIHSHPGGPDHPTYDDAVQQFESDIPWGIISLEGLSIRDIFFWGDGVPVAPFHGRPFKHNVYDCFALGRDILKVDYGIDIDNPPRKPLWWTEKGTQSLFLDGFKRYGFDEIDFVGLQPGDVVLMSIRARGVVNHCAIYRGNGLIDHHVYGDNKNMVVSASNTLYAYKNHITHCLRHQSLQAPVK